MQGKLYMLPVELGDAAHTRYLPSYNVEVMARLDAFVVENARTARQYLRKLFSDKDLSATRIFEADKHDGYSYPREEVFALLKGGTDVGFMSEAGCPGVADPGAKVVADCHRDGIEVVPLVGPSSILLGLMASGFGGQSFKFWGYLPFVKEQRKNALRDISTKAERQHETQIFIEAPYRNDALLRELADTLPPSLSICLCVDLTTPEEEILRLTVREWRSKLSEKKLSFHKRPAIFLVGK